MILRDIGGQTSIVLKELQSQLGSDNFYIWNSFNHSEEWAFASYARAVAEKKNLVCAETPLIGRAMFNEGDEESYYRVGINFVSGLHSRSFNLPDSASTDRLHEILQKTGTPLKDWRKDGDHIVYAMQVPADSSLRGLDIFAAAQYDLFQIRQISTRPIVVTLHPDLNKLWGKVRFSKNKQNFENFKKVASAVGAVIQIGGSHDALHGSWCSVCYTSGFAFDSISYGVPVITLSKHNFMSPISSRDLFDIDNPRVADEGEKLSWLSRVAYCQWNLSEIQGGAVRAHFRDYI